MTGARIRRGVPLRLGLVAAALVLVTFGLLASGIAVTSLMKHSLIGRVDQTLIDATNSWVQAPRPHSSRPHDGPNPARPPSKFYVSGVDSAGDQWTAVNDGGAEPDLPPGHDVGDVPTTVGSIGDSDVRWRAVSLHGPDGELTTVAMDLSEVDSTVDSLVLAQAGIGVAVLLVLGLAGYGLVQRSLRPLGEVEKTAAAIARGELDRRIPQRDPRTEVGRLSLALNGMLAQIQRAVADSEASAEHARRSEDRMRRFITDASHELRTPLTTIRGFAELYRQGAARDVEMLMSRIESEAGRMGLLVEDLLLLARLDSQRPLEQRPVDLLVLASDAVHDARSVAPNRSIALEVFDGPGIPLVQGDDARLRQVLSNLVSNALQHTPADAAITVRVGTDGDDAVLEVVDQGPGLAPEDAHRIFERFYRTDASRTRASGGSGLGLSIVDSLVRGHGGTVTVDAELGRGCRFRVAIPRLGGAEAVDEDAADAEPPDAEVPDGEMPDENAPAAEVSPVLPARP
ncbi:two-component sensor histidine kinase [Mycolicibacterium insubricum]|uniref:sensor histidine kinase n=1 Tax=Mycolicibacterium insubricum TaxID=444597 RepID=UPI00138C5356|nr:HAMP domain-containing sensor histidine kinase [Mycolicibacterium insubricum]BBZ68832.1 two-component sensor histidine kinase [Mycolicibacterium insubricum]